MTNMTSMKQAHLFTHRATSAITAITLALCLLMTLGVASNVTAQTPDQHGGDASQMQATQTQAKADVKEAADAEADADADVTASGEMIINDQAVNLRPIFEAGRTNRYSFWSQRDRDVVVHYNGEQKASSVRMIFQGEVTWAVKSVQPDGSATCVMTYDHIVTTVQTPDAKQQLSDSRKGKGDNEQIYRLITALAGTPIEFRMSADGKALGVSGTNAITQRLGEDLKALAPQDEEHIESAMDFATLPGAPQSLAVGQSWNEKYDFKHEVGRNKLTMNYHLARVESIAGIPVATIDTSSKPVIVPDYSKIPANGPKVNIRQTMGEHQGQVIFDLQRHDTVGSNSVRTIGLEITINLPNNQVIRREVTEKLQSQLLRLDEVQ